MAPRETLDAWKEKGGRRKGERQDRKKAFFSSLDSGQQRRTALWVTGQCEEAGADPGTHNSWGHTATEGQQIRPLDLAVPGLVSSSGPAPGLAQLSRTHVHNGFPWRLPTVFPNELTRSQRHSHRHHINVGYIRCRHLQCSRNSFLVNPLIVLWISQSRF